MGLGGQAHEGVVQELAAAPQPAAHGALGELEHDRELGAAEVFPVVQLERDLELERDRAEGPREQLPILMRRELAARRGAQVLDRHARHVDLGARALAASPVRVELVPRDREQVRAERRLAAEARVRREALRERRLHEILDLAIVAAALVPEEAEDGLEVSVEELLAGARVPCAPGPQLLLVALHANARIVHGSGV